MDDLVAVRIVHGNTVTALIQRRSVAEETVRTLASDGRHLFHDVVGNPVLVDTSDGASAQLVATPTGVPLADMLAPVPPSVDLAALVPETVKRPEPKREAPSAADLDPIEEITSSWGRTK